MSAGRPIYRYKPNTLLVLETMADGRWYARPVLRQLTGLKHDSLSPAVLRNYQCGRVAKRLNPLFDRASPRDRWHKFGMRACEVVFQITDAGIDALEREKALRARLRFRGFDDL